MRNSFLIISGSIWETFCYGLNKPIAKIQRYIDVLTRKYLYVTFFGSRVFTEVINSKRDHRWALIQYARCPYKTGDLDTETYTEGR